MSGSYEEAIARVEKIVARLESGNLSLEEAVASYEEGLKLLKTCYEKLHAAEKRIEELSGEMGTISTRTLDMEDTTPPAREE